MASQPSDHNRYIQVSSDFLKSFVLLASFTGVLAVFSFIRGFKPSEIPVVTAAFVFILFNLLIYSYQLAEGLYKNGETALSPGVWVILMALPGVNILVFIKMQALNKKMLKGMQVDFVPTLFRMKRRLGFTMSVSLAVFIGVLNWLTMTRVTGLTKMGELKKQSGPDSPYAEAFKESAGLMQKGEFYQGLQLLRNTGNMSPEERETYDAMVKTGYEGHAFVLSEKILEAVKVGDIEGVQPPFVEYLRWMDIYCEPMGIPKETLTQLRTDISHMQEVFPADKGATFREIREYYRTKAGAMVEDATARALLQSYVDVLLFTALQNIQNPSKSPSL